VLPTSDARGLDRPIILAGTAAAVVAFMVYLASLCPTLPPGDSGDLMTAAATLGVAHPPGYPLFSLIGHLFSWLPVGSTAFRLNLMSAVLDALAVGLVAVLIMRIVFTRSEWTTIKWQAAVGAAAAGIAGALFLGFGSEFWLYSLVAEVFALNNLFAALLLLLAITWWQDPSRRWVLWGFFLTAGLAFCNQQTIVLLAPGLATLLIGGIVRSRSTAGRWFHRISREFAAGIGFAVVGLLPYLYLPVAAAQHPPALWGDPSTPQRFWAVVTRADYGSFSLVAGGRHGSVGNNLSAFFSSMLGAFGPIGLLLAAAGLWWLARRRRTIGAALVLAFAATGPGFLAYANPPLGGLLSGVFARFYILPSIPVAIAIGCGAWQVAVWAGNLAGRVAGHKARFRLAASGSLAVLLILSATAPAVGRYASVDQSSNFMTINFVKDLLAPLDPGSILLTEGDTAVLGTWYVQNVEHYRPDVVVIAVPLLYYQWYIDEMRREHPDIVIPFKASDVIGSPVTDKVLDANVAARSVYYVGVISESFPSGYGELRTGFARKFVPVAEANDPFAFVRTHLPSLTAYHFPTRAYPATSWEAWESTYYGGAAFDLANAYESIDVATAEAWYREAINLAPSLRASYKDLAILLNANGGRPSEIVDLLERYLVLSPTDPEAPTIHALIHQLQSPSP
jgi:hypothetical protein